MCSAGACGDAAPREGGLVPGAESKAEHSRAIAPHGGLPASVGPWRLRDLPAALVRFQRMSSIINGCCLHVFFGLLFFTYAFTYNSSIKSERLKWFDRSEYDRLQNEYRAKGQQPPERLYFNKGL